MNDLPKRHHPRLTEYDYGQNGCYFLTLCTKGRKQSLSRICVGRGPLTPPEACLSPIGQVVEKHILRIDSVYPGVMVDNYVIMPNHVHLLLTICNDNGGGVRAPRPTDIPTVVRGLKSMVTREVGSPIWQTSYYDHVVRNEPDYLRIWEYIDTNPAKWQEDEYYE